MFELVHKTGDRRLTQHGGLGQPRHRSRSFLLQYPQDLELCRADSQTGDIFLALARDVPPAVGDLPPELDLVSFRLGYFVS